MHTLVSDKIDFRQKRKNIDKKIVLGMRRDYSDRNGGGFKNY